MTIAVNVYKKLNKREKYILETLDIEMEDKPITRDDVDRIISIINILKERLSPLPITNEQFYSAYTVLDKTHKDYFPNEDIMLQVPLYNKWPDKKINVLRTLSDDNIETLRILGFRFEDREIDAKEFMELFQPITNCLLQNFETGIKISECDKLIDKIYDTYYSKMTISDLTSCVNTD